MSGTRTVHARVFGRRDEPYEFWGVACDLTIPADTQFTRDLEVVIDSPRGSLRCRQFSGHYTPGPTMDLILQTINPDLDAAMPVLTTSPQVANLVGVTGVVIEAAPAAPPATPAPLGIDFTYERRVGGRLVVRRHYKL